MANLTIELTDKAIPLIADKTHIIGRHGDIKIHWILACVSRLHCSVIRSYGGWNVRDLNSHCGTKVNGVDIGTKDKTLIDGDVITVGKDKGRIHITFHN